MLAALLILSMSGQIPPLLKRPEPPTRIEFGVWYEGGVPEQVKAPCPAHPAVHTLEGKCWGRTTDKAPCPPETWEHKGACYVPVVAPPLPRS